MPSRGWVIAELSWPGPLPTAFSVSLSFPRNTVRRLLLTLGLVLVTAALALGGGVAWWLHRPMPLAAPVIDLAIEPGTLPREVAMAQRGLHAAQLRPPLPQRTVALLSRKGAYRSAACRAASRSPSSRRT